MRTVEEIKVDIASAKQPIWKRQFENELYKALTSDIPLDRLEEICAAEKDGRCVVLPCKVGDTVYAAKGSFYLPHAINIKSMSIIECQIRGIKRTAKGGAILLMPCIEEACGRRSAYRWFAFSAIGKTVFLTRAEAEKALGKEQGHD